jgi:hypothetical protein
VTEPKDEPQAPLPSRPSAGGIIGSIIDTLDQALTNRPRPVAAIEERYREPWASRDGFTVDGLDEPVEREEPPDRSGARL